MYLSRKLDLRTVALHLAEVLLESIGFINKPTFYAKMAEFKLVLGAKDGKSYQKEIKSPQADELLKKKIGETIVGDTLGFSGYKFILTGGSDKCGFPMRKGIQAPRKKILIGKSIGFDGKNRHGTKQPGLILRRTVCGERITKIIHQVNLKVLQEGAEALVAAEKKE